ncbi:hypothetical protein PIROE2DRAFT_12369 [Piromyces sp. E2]|nr:hypothetical protein PIROE2DRAFT_12369 [Piromyces sp. E2]|eukprot:OUM61588.1 hypothetical protein PIROE2DRAFT_12369 [Piromyces sp. E2]
MKLNIFLIAFSCIILSSLVGCEEVTLTSGPVFCEYKNKDTSDTYDVNSDNVIKCSGTSCTVNGTGATASEGVLSITSAGTYIIQGSLEGQIRMEVTENDFIHLVLDSATITSSDGPAIYGIAANKITITIVGENSLTDSANYSAVVDEEPDACLFVNADLSINGSGNITVSGNYGDAIRCKKDLKIVSGNIIVPNAVQRGIKAKNSLCIKEGTVDVTSTNSGIKVTRDNNSEKGYIVIDGGNIAISTKNDALHAETHLTINGGYIDIKESAEGIEGQMIDIIGGEVHVFATDDGINASMISSTDSTTSNNNNDKNQGMGMPGDMNNKNNTSGNQGMGMPGDMNNKNNTSGNQGMGMPNDMQGSKQNGGKPGGGMPGENSGSDGSVYINIVGGKTYVTVQGNDVDGIDANGVLYIGGEAEVYASINGGDVYGNMAALDADGTNAIVAGATVVVTADSNMGGGMGGHGNSGGNGRQNNGNMNNNNNNNNNDNANNGGDITAPPTKRQEQTQGQTQGQDQGQIPQGGFTGNMNSTDPNGGMMGPGGMGGPGGSGGMGGMGGPMGESGSIYQAYIKTSVNSQTAGTEIIVKDSNGNAIISYAPITSYSTILVSSPSLVAGQTYTITTGSDSITATASEADTGSVDPPSVTSPAEALLKKNSTSNGNSIKFNLFSIIILVASIFIIY